jgi:hypothetical protein
MTLPKAKSIARHLRLTLRQLCSGDYRVNFRDGNETTAYYTDSLEDAINTAVGMARRARGCTIQSWRRDLASPELQVIAEPAKADLVALLALMTLAHATHIGSDEQMFGAK